MDIHKRIKALNEATVLDSFRVEGKSAINKTADGYILLAILRLAVGKDIYTAVILLCL